MGKSYCVYMHSLNLDNRKYIGITCQKPTKRWGKNGVGYKEQLYFYRAIQKYGWNSFRHEIVFENLTKEQACIKEIALIKLFNTTDVKFGFNMTTGGETSPISHRIDLPIKDTLYEQYIVLGKTNSECAKYFGCSTATIARWLEFYNIKKVNKEIDPKLLKYLFIDLNWTRAQCADYFGCCEGNIARLLGQLNIKKQELPEISYADLYYYYIIQNWSMRECATYFNCGVGTIHRLTKKFNIAKDKEVVKENMSKKKQKK